MITSTMKTEENKSEITLVVLILLGSLCLLAFGGLTNHSNPKKITNLCSNKELKDGEKGEVRGIITEIQHDGPKANVFITEGADDCQGVLMAHYGDISGLRAGDRIKARVTGAGGNTFELWGKPTKDPTVVGIEVEHPSTTEGMQTEAVKITYRAQFASDAANYGTFLMRSHGIVLKLKMSREMSDNLVMGSITQITYYMESEIVASAVTLDRNPPPENN